MSADDVGGRPHADPDARHAVAIFGSFRYGPYYEDLLAGVAAAAGASGHCVIAIQPPADVLPSGFAVGGREAASRAAWDHFAAAIVVLQAVSLDYVAQLRVAGKFVVAIGQELRGAHAAIRIDNAGGVRAAVSHLAEHGHTKIGFIGPIYHVDAGERYSAYCGRMAELGLTALPLIGRDLSAQLSMDEQGHLTAESFVTGDRPCTAVVVLTDQIALGFIRGLQEAGLAVPADIAVVGIDDVDEAAVSTPPLATVAINFQRVGEAAFNVALQGSRGEPTQTHYDVPQRFVPRESCGCPKGSESERTDSNRSPIETFVQTLAEAARDAGLEALADPAEVTRVAHRVAALLAPDLDLNPGTDPDAAADRPAVEAVAADINALCALDRSLDSALKAIQVLAQALAYSLREPEPAQVWAVSAATLNLCDAIRSGKQQRRMSEYMDLKRKQISQYFIANSLLGSDRADLRSLGWLRHTHAQTGALGLWTRAGHQDQVTIHGGYDRTVTAGGLVAHQVQPLTGAGVPVESFPPQWMLSDATGRGRLVVLTQVRFEDSDWGVLAVAGGRVLQSSLVQESFQQWSILMSVSLDQEKANTDLARQARELTTAHDTEMALLEEVRVSEERYALAAEASHDALWDWDLGTERVFYSSNWKAMLGHRDNEIGSTPEEWLDRIHPDDALLVREQLNQALHGVVEYIDIEHRLRMSTGEYRWIACSGRSVTDDGGLPIRLVGSITDVTVRRLLHEQLLHEALFDGLTGLAKSTLFKDRLNQAIELANRRTGYWFAVVFVDLNGFKAINDQLGHAAGDELLASVAYRLKESLRKNDTAARLGGDEFAILLNDMDQASELPLIIRRIQSLINAPHQVGGHTATVGAAIGVAVSTDGYTTAEAMLHEADTAMYQAKRRNKEKLPASRT
jgi:diguanylate cyclase (GGDEF)-like protein/PAS domain S-box-containing protein